MPQVSENSAVRGEDNRANRDVGTFLCRDGVGQVIAHEFDHVCVYQQWGAKIGQTGTINGWMHSDGDAIPDSVETDTTSGSIGHTYEFNPNDADSYDMEGLWSNYR